MIKELSSFRDPSGFVFYQDEKVFRAIHQSYFDTYELVKSRGIFQALFEKGLFINHKEAAYTLSDISSADYPVILEVDKVPFISYPYEWSFSQLKDAALLTLKIQNFLIDKGLSLKDASAYNVQFLNGSPVFIDTLSIEIAKEGQPWKAYKQFCEHFLVPLLLMSHADVRLQSLLKGYINGIPLELAVKVLPFWLRFNLSVYTHVFLQQKYFAKYSTKNERASVSKISLQSQKNILKNLFDLISGLKLKGIKTEWGNYYSDTNYQDESFNHKKEIIKSAVGNVKPKSVWDIGANTGVFSRLFSDAEIDTISFDIDPLAVELNYSEVKTKQEKYILPLLLDITNPSPGIGWANNERTKISERSNPDMTMALALIHHLFITFNCSFSMVSNYFAALAPYLIIEFVPINDSQVQKLVLNRTDDYSHYTIEQFEAFFLKDWYIIAKTAVTGTVRTIFILKRK